MTTDEILGRLERVRPTGAERRWTAACPGHQDGRNSLSVMQGESGRTFLHCFAGCKPEKIVKDLGLPHGMADLFPTPKSSGASNGSSPLGPPVKVYDYCDVDGTLLYQNVRYHPPNEDKTFRIRRPDGAGGWRWNLGKPGDVKRVVYRLPELAEQRRIFLVEGEKDADNLWLIDVPATTGACGGESWRDEYSGQIRAAGAEEVVILPDNDETGRRYARTAAASLHAAGIAIRILELPGLPAKGDVSDWLAAGHTVTELEELVATAASDAPLPSTADAIASASELLGIGLGTFLAREFPAAEPLIEGVLSSDGGGWIGGEEKLGKTFYSIEEALCLALAQPICGRFVVPTRRRVLFVEEEDPPRRFHMRARALLRGHGLDPDTPALLSDLDQWFRLSVWEGFKLDDPAMVARLQTTIEEFRPAVVYLDVLRKMTLRNLNKAEEASPLLEVLDDLRRRYGVIFRVLHHFRKVQGFRAGRGSQEIGGSYVLGAWGENSLFFEPIGRKQGAVRVEVQSKDGAPLPGFRLIFEAEGPKHAPTLVRLKAEEDRSAEDADDVVLQAVATLPKTEALAGKSGVAVQALVSALKRGDKTIRRALKRLADGGRIEIVGQAAKGKDLYAVTSP